MVDKKPWVRPRIYHGVPTVYGWTVWHPDNFTLYPNTDIGAGTCVFAHRTVGIERGVKIGGGTLIYTRNTINNTEGPVIIREGARIGSHCLILPGVTIGEGAVVKAYCVVERSVGKGVVVPPYTVWKGENETVMDRSGNCPLNPDPMHVAECRVRRVIKRLWERLTKRGKGGVSDV